MNVVHGPLRKGSNAQEAAGEVHTDFFKKFIRAEVVHNDDFVKAGSFSAAKEEGAWRLEGKGIYCAGWRYYCY